MPDMERIIDQLRVDMAELGYKSKAKRQLWDGYRSGKSRARWEVVIVLLLFTGLPPLGITAHSTSVSAG